MACTPKHCNVAMELKRTKFIANQIVRLWIVYTNKDPATISYGARGTSMEQQCVCFYRTPDSASLKVVQLIRRKRAIQLLLLLVTSIDR